MPGDPRPTEVRLAELVAALSLVVDLGLGQPVEHVLRQTLIAMRLGGSLGLSEEERAALYYVALLAWVGCGSDSHELATRFGDDLAWRAASYEIDPIGRDATAFLMRRAAAVNPPLQDEGAGDVAGLKSSAVEHCVVTRDFSQRVGLGPDVANPLLHLFERWDGRGRPNHLVGEAIALPARIVQFADVLVPFHRAGGVEAAVTVARERRGTQFDPGLVDLVCAEANDIFAAFDERDGWDTVLANEPGLWVSLTDEEFDRALEAIADFTDLKSPYTLGHARGVASLVTEAARTLRLADEEVVLTRRAALVQDAGRMGVSNSIWDKPALLSSAEMERVRLHAYYGERMFQRPPKLARIGTLAAQHHERLDGSGYPRGLSGSALMMPARILAAADTYRALVEPRPHRPALTPAAAATTLRSEVEEGAIGRGCRQRRPRRCWASRAKATRVAAWPHRARGRGARSHRTWVVESRGRSSLATRRENSRPSRRAHLREDRVLHACGGQPLRDAARPPRSRPVDGKIGRSPDDWLLGRFLPLRREHREEATR